MFLMSTGLLSGVCNWLWKSFKTCLQYGQFWKSVRYQEFKVWKFRTFWGRYVWKAV